MNDYHIGALFLSICITLLPNPSYGETAVSVDNDLFAASGTDRNYTGGLRLTHRVSPSKTWQTGVLLYTPSNLNIREPRGNDRPYANLIFGSRSKEHLGEQSITRLTLTGGVIGSRIGSSLHRAVHRLSSSDIPQGYRNQISDGGEPTARAGWTRYSVLFDEPTKPARLILIRESSASIGYITDATIGLGFKLSKLPSWWGNARHNFLNKLDEPEGSSPPGLFGGIRVRAIGYNALLQGQFRSSTHTVNSNKLRRIVGEAWLGFSARFKNMNISYTIRAESPEFDGAHNTIWASITVSQRH